MMFLLIVIFLDESIQEINPPISIIYYDYYDDISQVSNFINENRNQIQCIVTNLQIDNSTGFGDAQDPKWTNTQMIQTQ